MPSLRAGGSRLGVEDELRHFPQVWHKPKEEKQPSLINAITQDPVSLTVYSRSIVYVPTKRTDDSGPVPISVLDAHTVAQHPLAW